MVLRGRRVWLRVLGVGGMWGAHRSQGVRVRLQGKVAELSRAKGPGICLFIPPASPSLPSSQDLIFGRNSYSIFPKKG